MTKKLCVKKIIKIQLWQTPLGKTCGVLLTELNELDNNMLYIKLLKEQLILTKETPNPNPI